MVSDVEGAGSSPFPERGTETVRIDSVAEAYAYFTAWPPPDGPWEHVGQRFAPGPAGPEDHLTVRAPDGQSAVVRFAIRSFFSYPGEALVAPGEQVAAAMRAGHELAKSEGPLHPGTLPQYPVPSESHSGAVAVPLPILAVDAGQRGLFAPPRIAVVRWSESATRPVLIRSAGHRHVSATGRHPRCATGRPTGWRERSSASARSGFASSTPGSPARGTPSSTTRSARLVCFWSGSFREDCSSSTEKSARASGCGSWDRSVQPRFAA
jgi:hypothetical protein